MFNLKIATCYRFLWLFFFSALILAPSPSRAHRVTIFAWVVGDTVHTESKFGPGQKVRGGEVLVFDEAGNRLLAGKTDDNGKFSFPVPQQSALKIVLNATMGHRAEWFIPLHEITGNDKKASPRETKPEKTTTPQKIVPKNLTAREIEDVVERVLDRKLKPLNRMLAESQQPGPSFRDIIGGIGYIFGLIGVAAWFRYRR